MVRLHSLQKILVGIVMLLTAFIEISKAQNEYRFDKITSEDGLSQSVISAVIQDHFGYLWIGTLDGLNRYDGKQYKIYKHDIATPNSISTNRIQALFLDNNNQLWVLFRGGIARYLPQYDSFENLIIDIKNEDYSKVAFHSATNMTDSSFIFSTNKGFLGFSVLKKKFYRIAEFKQFNHLNINSYLNVPQLGEWVFSHNKTLARFNKKEGWIDILKDTLAIANYYDKKSNEIYLQTKSKLYKYDPTKRNLITIDKYRDSEFDSNNFGMIKQNNGKLWVYRKEIYIYDTALIRETTLTHLAQNPFSISGNHLSCIYESQDGVVWVGMNGLGLNKFNPNTSVFNYVGTFYGAPITLSENYISAVYAVNEKDLYVGTIASLDHVDLTNNKSQSIELKAINGSQARINKFLKDDKDKIWLLTDKGLKFIKNNIVFPSGIQLLDGVNCYLNDYAKIGEHQYIFSSGSGLYLWNNQTNSAKKISSSYGSGPICLFNKKIWIDADESIIVLEATNFTVEKKYPKLANNKSGFPLASIRCFYIDHEGKLWIGSWGGGLTLFNESTEKFTSYTEKDGLPDLVIYSILEDNQNNLWLSSNKGISVFDKRKNRVVRSFSKEDGLQGNEFNTRASFKSPSGNLFFGGTNGLTFFNPEAVLKLNHPAPQAVLSGFYINHKRVDTFSDGLALNSYGNQSIDLNWEERNFDIELSSLNYSLASNTHYKYILENFDAQWNDLSDRSFISYTNIPAGNYVLKVKAYNVQGAMQKDELTIRINVNQPFWKNQYFLIYVAISLVIFFTIAYKIRTNSLRRRSETLAKMVTERTRELQIKNEEIGAQNEEISAQNEEITSQNETLAEIKTSLEKKVENRTASLRELNKKLASQNSQLEQFSFIAAHNIKGPVARIKGLINLLSRESLELTYLKDAVKDLDHLILDLNSILDVQYNTHKKEFELVKISEVLTQVISTFNEEIKLRNAEIKIVGIQEYSVKGIKSYFSSIFYNLLSNALKYSDPNRKQIIQFASTVEETQLKILISDTGLGIDMQYTKGKIFNMYQRFHPEINGKGFGLFLVRSQIEAMHGKISVESEVGKGTNFTISFDNWQTSDSINV